MGKQSPRQYFNELSDLVFSEQGSSNRADKLFDILEGLGYSSDIIMNAIDSGNSLPSKEEYGKKKFQKLATKGRKRRSKT